MINKTGSSHARDTKWAETGTPKIYDPSPTQQMTLLSGLASLAPSAAPNPQPSAAEGECRKYVPGVSKHVWVGSRTYSLITMLRSSIMLPTQDEAPGHIDRAILTNRFDFRLPDLALFLVPFIPMIQTIIDSGRIQIGG